MVLHTVYVDDKTAENGLSYDDAQEIVEMAIKPGDTITEEYDSSGYSVHYSYDEFMNVRKVSKNLQDKWKREWENRK